MSGTELGPGAIKTKIFHRSHISRRDRHGDSYTTTRHVFYSGVLGRGTAQVRPERPRKASFLKNTENGLRAAFGGHEVQRQSEEDARLQGSLLRARPSSMKEILNIFSWVCMRCPTCV